MSILWQRLLYAIFALLLVPFASAASGANLEKIGLAFFPGAQSIGAFDGDPPSAPVRGDGKPLGYLFRTGQIEPIPAYSGKPIDALVGIDLQGHIRGVRVLEHHEPILLAGIPESKLDDFSDQYVGKSVSDRIRVGSGQLPGYVNVDAIAGATVTVVVLNDAVMRSAQRVAMSRGLIAKPREARRQPAQIRADVFSPRSWSELLGDGSIRARIISRGDVDDAFKGTPAEAIDKASEPQRGEQFAELYYTLLDAPTVGRNLLGEEQYRWLMDQLEPGEHAIAVLGNGYSFKGSGYVRGGIFDRLQLQQDNRPISFRDRDYVQLTDLGLADVPHFREMAIFIVRAENAFDPGQPWQLELLVRRQTGPLDSLFSLFSAEYQSPEAYLERPPEVAEQAATAADDVPLWQGIWSDRVWRVAVLLVGLVTLVLVLLLQDILVRRPVFLRWLHRAFQLYTLVFLGWYALAQLSVVNVLTLANSLMQGFRWETFLMEPLLFILWSFVAVSLLLWGRGLYCGWLCPFGALQELLNDFAIRLEIPQWRLPFAINQRLWTLKYLILFALFGVSLHSLGQAEKLAEVEPFKTVFLLNFLREWGYVLYALALLAVSLFSRKWYCRYLCPLGAALAIPGRLRLFDWLRRRPECGQPCRLCANECEVQAIHPDGRIDGNECHYCLDCQVTYHDRQRCPPLVARERRRNKSRTAEVQAERIDIREI